MLQIDSQVVTLMAAETLTPGSDTVYCWMTDGCRMTDRMTPRNRPTDSNINGGRNTDCCIMDSADSRSGH